MGEHWPTHPLFSRYSLRLLIQIRLLVFKYFLVFALPSCPGSKKGKSDAPAIKKATSKVAFQWNSRMEIKRLNPLIYYLCFIPEDSESHFYIP